MRRNKVGLKGWFLFHTSPRKCSAIHDWNDDTGILYTPVERSGHTSWNVAMRQQLDIYASLVLCKSVPGFPTRHSNVDFAIIRENTEGEYSGLEHQVRSFPLRSIFLTHHITQLPVMRARTNDSE
jgi:isocitrate/isopropylmalate dehydrogenase